MKVGFLLDDHMYRAGGVQEYVRGMVRYLESHGHEAVVFSGGSQYNDPLPERVIQLGVSLPFKGNQSSTSIPIVFRSGRALRQLLHQEACDLLHVQTPFSPTMSGRLLAQSDVAHMLTFHIRIDSPVRLWLLRQLARLLRPSFRRIHKRLAISPAAVETGACLFPGDYEVVGVGVDTEAFAAAVEQPPLPQYADDTVTILTVGRLERRKGVHHLLHAFQVLERDHGTAVRLVVAGDGPEREALQTLATELKLKHVEWLGFVPADQLPHLMASADLFCAPATGQESFGYVLIEAMAAALPIVAYANAGYAGVLAQHAGNVLVPVGAERALAGALAMFVASPALRHHVSAANRHGAQRHSWDHVGAQVLRAYQETLALHQAAIAE